MKREFELIEVNACYCGSLMGYYCDGHVDIFQFHAYAIADYSDYLQEEDDPDDILGDSIPFSDVDIKHMWFRYPTEEEMEREYYEYEEQFVISKVKAEGFKPITYLEFDF